MSFEDRAQVAVSRIRRVPCTYRRYSVDRADAKRGFGMDQDVLTVLLDLGLPHSGTEEGILFDALDLENAAMVLRLPSPPWSAVRLWKRSLRDPAALADGICRMKVSWFCPDAGHPGPCRFSHHAVLAGSSDTDAPDSTDPGVTVTEAQLDVQEHDFGENLAEVVAESRTFELHKLPEPLGADLGFLAGTGLADCQLATRRLVLVASRAGLTVRPASGYFAGIPFPTPHVWLEVLCDGRWTAADPFFLRVLHDWGIVRSSDWPLTRSPRHVLWRLAHSFTHVPLVTHQGRRAPTNVMARWVPAVPRHGTVSLHTQSHETIGEV